MNRRSAAGRMQRLTRRLRPHVRGIRGELLRFAAHGWRRGEWPDSVMAFMSDGNRPTFFGYHDKTPFSGDDGKVLAMSLESNDAARDAECTPIRLGYFESGPEDWSRAKFVPFARTSTWSWQQGCMLQWHPVNANTHVFFNSLNDSLYGSTLHDISRDRCVQKYSRPLYSVAPNGKRAVSLNFSRLHRLRPGYGYRLLPDRTSDDCAPGNDGLFILDLASGRLDLAVSIAEIAAALGDPAGHHYINHATFSPDSRRIVFFHCVDCKGSKKRDVFACSLDLSKGTWSVLEKDFRVSHYCWLDSARVLATRKGQTGKTVYSVYDIAGKKRLDSPMALDMDGHPMRNPRYGDIIVTDAYPDVKHDQHLYVANVATGRVRRIAELYSPYRYRGQVRCDLHPRWNRTGELVAVDTTHTGRRSMGILKPALTEAETSNVRP